MTSKKTASSSFDPGVSPGSYHAVAELGEAIVAQLDLEHSNDVLGRWMAHWVSELIAAARYATDAGKADAERRCADAVFELWRYRNCLPDGHRPLDRMEPVMDLLASLDPERHRTFYRPDVWDDLDEDDPSSKPWIEAAHRFDGAARTVLEHIIVKAAETATDESREWVRKAKGAGVTGVDLELSDRIVVLTEQLRGRGTADETLRRSRIQALRARLKALADFEEVASAVRDDIQARLQAVEEVNLEEPLREE